MLGHNAALAAPPAAASGPALDACYRQCGAIARFHSKSFYLSTRFLPLPKRRAVWAVYAFCRTADDIVDRDDPSGGRLAAIDAWEEELRGAYTGRASHPILIAYADAAVGYDVPLQAALNLLRGARLDIAKNRYATYDDLRRYCYLVASTVGILVTPILGALEPAALDDAVTLGHAMQMTNILRDVGEDAGLNRIYLPAEDMRRFGYGEADLLAGTIDGRFIALMQFEIDRTRALYRAAEAGIARLEPESRYAVRLALHLYRGILDAIEANGYDVFTKRAFVPVPVKLRTAVMLGFRR